MKTYASANNAKMANGMRAIMNLAWTFVRKNGFSLSEALKVAWKNFKLRDKMHAGIVKFHFTKVDGSIREAYGTLDESKGAVVKGTGKKVNATCQTYFVLILILLE